MFCHGEEQRKCADVRICNKCVCVCVCVCVWSMKSHGG